MWRYGSRACTFDRCSSITGNPTEEIASMSAIELWV